MFGYGLPLCHIERTIVENGLRFNDGAHIVYVNGENREDTTVGNLMHDFSCVNPDDMKYKVLAERARYLKQDQKGVTTMCRAMEELIEEDKIESAEKLIAKGKMTLEDIAECLSLSLEKVTELATRLQPHMA